MTSSKPRRCAGLQCETPGSETTMALHSANASRSWPRKPLAAQAAAALAQAMGRVQTDGPHAAVGKARLVVKLQHHGGESQLAQGARARAIGGALGHALLLAQRQRARLPIARAKAELVIEPPRARLDGLLVVRAELVGID